MYVNTWYLSTNLFNRPTTQFNKEIVQRTRQGYGALESDCIGSYPLSPPVVLGQLIKISGSWFIYLKTEIIIAPTLQDCMRLNDCAYYLSIVSHSKSTLLFSGAEKGVCKLHFSDPFASGHLIVLSIRGTKRWTGKSEDEERTSSCFLLFLSALFMPIYLSLQLISTHWPS